MEWAEQIGWAFQIAWEPQELNQNEEEELIKEILFSTGLQVKSKWFQDVNLADIQRELKWQQNNQDKQFQILSLQIMVPSETHTIWLINFHQQKVLNLILD